MVTSETEITNLLYRYAEYVDTGNLDGVTALFEHAELRVAGTEGVGTVDGPGLTSRWREIIVFYAGGTPRTKHVVTNPIVEIDEDAGTATCRSYYTVFQATEGLALQAIISGRYHDRFERVDGGWRFAFRDYTLVDLVGDLSHHVPQRVDLAR